MDLETIEHNATKIADTRNHEPVLGLLRRVQSGVTRDEIAKDLARTCEFAQTYRKLRKKLSSVASVLDRLREGRCYTLEERLGFYEMKLSGYVWELQETAACGECASCVHRGFAKGERAPTDEVFLRAFGQRSPKSSSVIGEEINRRLIECSVDLRASLLALLSGE